MESLISVYKMMKMWRKYWRLFSKNCPNWKEKKTGNPQQNLLRSFELLSANRSKIGYSLSVSSPSLLKTIKLGSKEYQSKSWKSSWKKSSRNTWRFEYCLTCPTKMKSCIMSPKVKQSWDTRSQTFKRKLNIQRTKRERIRANNKKLKWLYCT